MPKLANVTCQVFPKLHVGWLYSVHEEVCIMVKYHPDELADCICVAHAMFVFMMKLTDMPSSLTDRVT